MSSSYLIVANSERVLISYRQVSNTHKIRKKMKFRNAVFLSVDNSRRKIENSNSASVYILVVTADAAFF